FAALIWVGVGRGGRAPAVPVSTQLAAADAPAPRPEAVPLAVADRIIADDAPRAVQFVLDAPGARAVAVIGGFNGWDPAAAPLERVPGSTVWTTTVLLEPGRYTYAFIVDDSTWVLDPRAPRAEDQDYGVESAATRVGREGRRRPPSSPALPWRCWQPPPPRRSRGSMRSWTRSRGARSPPSSSSRATAGCPSSRSWTRRSRAWPSVRPAPASSARWHGSPSVSMPRVKRSARTRRPPRCRPAPRRSPPACRTARCASCAPPRPACLSPCRS